MPPLEIKNNIFWVGVIDWNVRDFHGYFIENGTTYNSFLLLDEKNVLFDTVKKNFYADLFRKIRNVIDPPKIDYLVINHVETDHSGCLLEIVRECKPEKIFCSKLAVDIINKHYHNQDFPIHVVGTGDEISTGKRTIKFIESRMLHWPDSMVSYIPEEKLLISNDIFGQHYATSERFDDEVPFDELIHQSKKYYANIILPYGKLVLKFANTLKEHNIDINMIACDHGVIWRKHIGKIIELYTRWASYESDNKVAIIYDTMWQSTEMMARAIEQGVIDEGVPVVMMRMGSNTRADVITEVMDAKAIILGSSTLNNNYLPSMGDVITYTKGLRPANKIGAAFGSYGWGGEAVKLLNAEMQNMGWEIVDEGVRVKYVPTEEELNKCVELGKKVAGMLKLK